MTITLPLKDLVLGAFIDGLNRKKQSLYIVIPIREANMTVEKILPWQKDATSSFLTVEHPTPRENGYLESFYSTFKVDFGDDVTG